jgi:hypothetical protein
MGLSDSKSKDLPHLLSPHTVRPTDIHFIAPHAQSDTMGYNRVFTLARSIELALNLSYAWSFQLPRPVDCGWLS